MTTIKTGPAIVAANELDNAAPKDVSIRMLSDYFIETDTCVTRFDILLDGNQFNVNIAGDPASADPNFNAGKPMTRENMQDLILPRHLAERRWATVSRVNRKLLASAFRQLADVLDK